MFARHFVRNSKLLYSTYTMQCTSIRAIRPYSSNKQILNSKCDNIVEIQVSHNEDEMEFHSSRIRTETDFSCDHGLKHEPKVKNPKVKENYNIVVGC